MPVATLKQPEFFEAPRQRVKPFLKWAGGKYRVLDRILPLLPSGKRLIEPFAGSAAVSLNAEFDTAFVSDFNEDLINLYSSVKADPERFILDAQKIFGVCNNRDDFNSLRAEFNESSDAFRKSVIFVYLNRHGFNGLCRYNAKGKFNVPFGKYTNPSLPTVEIRAFASAAENLEFKHQDFLKMMAQAVIGDVVYCDPPYVPLSTTSNFTSYAPGDFGTIQQRQLADAAKECAARGVPVVISNHDTAESRALYAGSEIHSFPVRRFISSKAETRGNAQELLAIFK